MRQVLLIVDIQSTFSPPEWLVDGAAQATMHGIGANARMPQPAEPGSDLPHRGW